MSSTFGDGVLQQLLQATPQGVWFLDARGLTVDLNDAMCRLLGRGRGEVVGRAAPDFFQDAHRATLERELAARHRGAAGVYEADIVRPDGSVCHCINHATPLVNGEGVLVGSVGLWTDLTAQRRNEQALHGYAFAFNSISEAVSVVDPEMRYVMVNDAWCRITGLAREAAIGRRATQLLGTTGYLTDERRLALEGCLREGREARVTSAHVGPDGALRHLETTHTPYRDAAGELRGAVLTTRDVTAEQRMIALLQASEAQQRALLEAFPGFIAAVDEQVRYTYVNERLAQLWGRPAHEIVGRGVRELHPAAHAERIEAEVRAAFAGQVTRSERHFPMTPEAPVPAHLPAYQGRRQRLDVEVLHVAGPPGADGRRSCFVFGIDVTERMAAQEALRAARDEAEQANRAKSRFLAQMSHELRTPLHAISGFAQLLERDPRTPLTSQQAGFVGEIQHGAQHLLELINEVLDLGRIEAGRMQLQLETVPLPALLQECVALVQPLARDQGVCLREVRFAGHAALPWAVRADRMRLKQVLLNLLANAVKYNRRDGEVDLGVEAVAEAPGGPALRIVVRDTGPGLDDAALERLFRPFERLGAEGGAVEGTGIGLALSRRLVLAMGGRIGVDSRPGEGSRFWVDLPQATATTPALAAGPAPADPPRDTGLEGATVLHVDDNPVNLVLMEAMLRLLPGLRLVSAENAAEGLRLALQERPRLVLLDIQLPDMDGFEVLARLRASEASEAVSTGSTAARVPVVAVSANAMPADIEAAREAGFADYLTKPLDLERLHATVRRLLAPR